MYVPFMPKDLASMIPAASNNFIALTATLLVIFTFSTTFEVVIIHEVFSPNSSAIALMACISV